MNYSIKDINLASQGEKNLIWASKEMPVLKILEEQFIKTQPFKNINITACLHITKETAVLLTALKAGGARVSACGSNPLSTQDDITAILAQKGIEIYAYRGCSNEDYYKNLNLALDIKPDIIIDDGADLINALHTSRKELLPNIIGGMEETTTGVIRLKAMEKDNALLFPVIAVNDSKTKHLFDNYYGTGQSTIDGILRSTNIMLAGKTVVIAGYGDCGKGIAKVLRGMGSIVYITEIDPVKALQAVMDGYQVKPMNDILPLADIIITVTGNKDVITAEHIKLLKENTIICNSGHFNVEIAIEKINAITKTATIRDNMVEYKTEDNKTFYILGEGRLINLAGAEGHPSAVMDMSFANQASGVLHLLNNKGNLANKVHTLPSEVDDQIASLKLQSLNIAYDKLSQEQQKYLSSWQEGT